MGCRIGEGGGALVLGEMDVARVNRSDQGTSSALDPVRAPTVSDCDPILGATPGQPLTRWTTSTRPGLRRASGMGMMFARGQKEGSVVEKFPTNHLKIVTYVKLMSEKVCRTAALRTTIFELFKTC